MNLFLSLPSLVGVRLLKIYDYICRRVAGVCMLSYVGFSVRLCDCEGMAVFSSVADAEEKITKVLRLLMGRGVCVY
jgi:hypothetical protein